MNKISVNHFEKKISDYFEVIIDDCEFTSQLYLFKGINGSGKSVILQYLSGLLKAEGIKSTCDHILFLTNYDIVFPYLTIRENIELSKTIYGISNNTVETDRLYTEEQLETLASNASLGMKLKVGLSLITVRKHWDLIVIDETLSNIDQASKTALLEELEKRKKEGAIIFLVDHNFTDSQAERFVKVTVKEGRIYNEE